MEPGEAGRAPDAVQQMREQEVPSMRTVDDDVIESARLAQQEASAKIAAWCFVAMLACVVMALIREWFAS